MEEGEIKVAPGQLWRRTRHGMKKRRGRLEGGDGERSIITTIIIIKIIIILFGKTFHTLVSTQKREYLKHGKIYIYSNTRMAGFYLKNYHDTLWFFSSVLTQICPKEWRQNRGFWNSHSNLMTNRESPKISMVPILITRHRPLWEV